MGLFDELKQGAGVVVRGAAAYYTAGGSEIALEQQRDAARAAKAMGLPAPVQGLAPRRPRPRAAGPPLTHLVLVGSLGIVALMVVAKGIQ